MTPDEFEALREHLGREPGPMERVSWAQRLRHERRGTDGGPTLEDYLREYTVELQEQDWRDRGSVVAALQHDRDNVCLPGDVSSGLPLSEEEIVAAYDVVLADL